MHVMYVCMMRSELSYVQASCHGATVHPGSRLLVLYSGVGREENRVSVALGVGGENISLPGSTVKHWKRSQIGINEGASRDWFWK